ncbi:MAG: N-acetyltransferase [Methanobacteriota archaeon]|nr:MAG: N-acetyltransferase [Euryarchaeota archaeon]
MEKVFVHPTAELEKGALVGEGTKIWHFAHVRNGARLGKNVIIGKSSYIDTGVTLGDNVKVQNLVSVYNGVTVGNNVFIGPHVAFTNDLYPRAVGDWQIVKTLVQDGASIGANATIVCGNTIGSYALVAAGAVVTRSVPSHALVAGNPAKLKGWVCKCARKIAGKDLPAGTHEITCQHCGQTNTITVPN